MAENWRTSLKAMFLDFASNTGIHGLKYTIESGRRPVERILWVAVVLGGLIGGILMASNFWTRFRDRPTRASVETNHYPTWRIPFPAITLCNANRIFRSKAEQFVDSLDLPEELNKSQAMRSLTYLEELIQPMPNRRNPFRIQEATAFQNLLEKQDRDVRYLMSHLDQHCYELLERCMWKGVMVNCSHIFEERKSYIGYCCSFNYRGVIENITEDGRIELIQADKKIEHTRFYSHRMGLTVLLNPAVHDYYLSTLFSAGVRMLIHGSDDYPDDTALEKILPVGRELLLRIIASSHYCTGEVKRVSPSVRGCVFQGEKKLRFFPIYSATNCLTECRMNYSNIFCNCTPFYYHEVGEFRLCNIQDIPCLNRYFFTMRTRRASTISKKRTVDPSNSSIECNCPPLCNDVSYEVQFSSGDFKASKFQRSKFFDGANVTDRILFHLYFGNHVSTRTRTDVISSWNDLLSSLGGVFSLFMGCSFMTVIEIIYFFSIRLYLHRYKRKDSLSDRFHDRPTINVRPVTQVRLVLPARGVPSTAIEPVQHPAVVEPLAPPNTTGFVVHHRFF